MSDTKPTDSQPPATETKPEETKPEGTFLSAAQEDGTTTASGKEGEVKKEGETKTEEKPQAKEEAASSVFDFKALKVPEGIEVPEEHATKFSEIMSNEKLSAAERGQALLDMYAELQKGSMAVLQKQVQEQQEQWRQELAAIKEFSGPEGKKLLSTFAKVGNEVLGKDGYAELTTYLDATGAGSHPGLVRVIMAMAKRLGEGTPVASQGSPGTLTGAEALFPTMRS